MLEVILDKYIIYVLMGAFAILGVVSKVIVSLTLGGMVRGAENMGKSSHPLMRLVRAKFEHMCMISERVENVGVFVDKYLYEHRVAGVKLHTWRRMELASAGMCLVLGAFGAAAEYGAHGMQDGVLWIGATGAVLAVCVFLIHQVTDEKFRLEAARNYMVDYLENICLHRYEKNHQKDDSAGKNVAAFAPEVPIPDFGDADQVRPDPGREVPSPRTSPEIKPPVMPEPYKAPKEVQKQQIPVRELRIEPETGAIQMVSKENNMESRENVKEPRKAPKKEKREESKDVLIRQILEEFMA